MTRLTGDHNADGRVDAADLTAATAQGLPFSAATETLANWGKGVEPPPVYILPLQPYVYEDRFEALAFSCARLAEVKSPFGGKINSTSSPNVLVSYIEIEEATRAAAFSVSNSAGQAASLDMPEFVTHTEIDCLGQPWVEKKRTEPCERVIVRNAIIGIGPGMFSGVGAWGSAETKATRSIWFIGCAFVGDGIKPVPGANAAEWGGGIWFHGCTWDNCKTTPANARAFVDCHLSNMTSEGFHNARAVYSCTVNTIKKPPGSAAHPDCIQLAFPSDPGPCCYFRVSGAGLSSQGFFARCPAVKAIGLADASFACDPNAGYKSQILGLTTDDLVVDNVRITDQMLNVSHDPKADPPRRTAIKRCAVRGLVVPRGKTIDLTSGFVDG